MCGTQSQPSSLLPLKESISVLFSFTRRVLDDTQFQTDIHLWLQRLVHTQTHTVNLNTSPGTAEPVVPPVVQFSHAMLWCVLCIGGSVTACGGIRRAPLPVEPSAVLFCRGGQVGCSLLTGETHPLSSLFIVLISSKVGLVYE